MPKLYRTIVFTVEALQLTADSWERSTMWCGGQEVTEMDPIDRTKKFVAINIPTIAGIVRASEGDYIVKEKNGNFVVLSAANFESKYEAAE